MQGRTKKTAPNNGLRVLDRWQPAFCSHPSVLSFTSVQSPAPRGGPESTEHLFGPSPGSAAMPDLPDAERLSRVFRAAAKRVLPAVVVIKTSDDSSPIANPDFWGSARSSDMSNGDAEDVGGFYVTEEVQTEPTLASGVVIDPAGIVLTNQHVIEGADRITVLLPDGREFKVSQITSPEGVDLAVLRLETNDHLPAATLGNSDSLDIGDWILTVGCPLELEQTVSAGIISAKGRSVEGAGSVRLLQTDAAINPGSSGGPLVNLRGEVVGITTAIASEDGGYQGIGFAIPINLLKQHQR